MNIEFAILDFIQEHIRSPLLDKIMPFVTLFGDGGIFWIVVTLMLMVIPKTRKLGIAAAVSLVVEALCCNVIIKPLVARIRPYDVRNVALLVKAPTDYSFPSGHTGASFAVATALCFGKSPKLGIPAVVMAVVIAFSRLYLYVHYPTDVLAGMVIGTITGFLGVFVVERMEKKREHQGKNE